jgi:hypothetical protein
MKNEFTIHTAANPFPVKTPKGTFIIDEECQCGGLRSQHKDTISYGHGSMGTCPKFTWKRFLIGEPIR